jgi:hypothetical protein
MDVNDNAGCLAPRVALASIASMLAPTGDWDIAKQPFIPKRYKNKYDTSFYV